VISALYKRFKMYQISRKIKKLNVYVANSTPYFSVIIPIYDRTVELRGAINSILSQTFRSFELLLICDGSPPETIEVVKSFTENPNVKTYFFQDNSGNPCRGRNKGIELSSGQFVAFLDSDDLALPNRLERTLFHVLEKKVDIVGGAIKYLTEKETCREFRNGQIGFTSEECTYDLLLNGNRLSICTVAVRKSCLSQYGAFREDMRYREDHELWLRLAYHGCSFYNSPEVFALYRVHENNAELSYLKDDQHWFSKALEFHRTTE
jgi:glycosyltransferase involved in cell wall biosynthesis